MPVEVPFVYEVETNADYSDEDMNSNILPKVEQAIGDGILPLFFAECAPDDGGDVSAFLSFVGENIMGIAASPPDLAISDKTASCSVLQPQLGNSCTVVEGIMTVYVPPKDAGMSETDAGVIIMATQDAIRQVMESGTLDDGAIHDSIESVSYGQDGTYQKEPTVILGTDKNDPNEGGGGGSLAYIAFAGAAVVVGAVLAIVGAKTRRRQDEDEDDYESDEDEEEGNDENDVSGFHDNPTEVADRDGKRTYDMEPVTGEDWAAVGTTAAVLASASDAPDEVEETGAADDAAGEAKDAAGAGDDAPDEVEEAGAGEEEEQQQ